MNLHHLKYFYDSARLKSLTKAAELNSVGQPAVSKAIQSLEASFRKNLLVHERNRFRLTEEGEIVYSYCQKVFRATEEMRDSLTHPHAIRGDVRLGWQSSMAECQFLTKALKSTNDLHPEISLKLRLGRTDLVCSWVTAGWIDFGVVIENLDLSEFETRTLASGQFYLVKSTQYEGNWNRDGVLTVEGKPEVLELQRLYRAKTQQSLKTKMEISSWGVIKKFALEGIGIGLVPDYMVQDELKNKSLMLVEPKSYAIPYKMKLIRKKSSYTSKKDQAVMDEICRLSPEKGLT